MPPIFLNYEEDFERESNNSFLTTALTILLCPIILSIIIFI